MSAILASPKPNKPWKATGRQRAETASILIIAVFLSVALVAVTPLKGKLGYLGSFVLIYLALDYSIVRFNHGKSAGVDAFFRGLVTMAIGSP